MNIQIKLEYKRKHYQHNLHYSEKIWRVETLAQMAQNGKKRQIKSAPKFSFYSALNLIRAKRAKFSPNKAIPALIKHFGINIQT